MPTFKPKTNKKIKYNKKNSITLDEKHKEFLNEFTKYEYNTIPELKSEKDNLMSKLENEKETLSLEQKLDIKDRINDINVLIKEFTGLFMEYVNFVENQNFNDYYLESKDVKKSIAIQNDYSFNQRKNDKTSKALSAYIGADKAREFIDTILFPVY
jgi:hypothetical protein